MVKKNEDKIIDYSYPEPDDRILLKKFTVKENFIIIESLKGKNQKLMKKLKNIEKGYVKLNINQDNNKQF